MAARALDPTGPTPFRWLLGHAQAASLWLRNRQPAKWRDRQQVDMTGSMEHRIAAMTPDERAADAVALVERVRARLAALRTIEHEPEE
jgi:hypothetical protein